MKAISALAVAVVGLGIAVPRALCASNDSPIAQEIESAVVVDTLAIARSPKNPWVVLRVSPDLGSGLAATTNGVELAWQPVSGNYVVEGQLGSAPSHLAGRYGWKIEGSALRLSPTQARAVRQASAFSYHAGLKDSFVVCTANEGPTGLSFANISFVPEGWATDVQPAVQYFRAHPEISDVATPITRLALDGLTWNKNPYIVVTATRALCAAKMFGNADLNAILATNDSRLIGSCIAEMWLSGWPYIGLNSQVIKFDIGSCKSITELEGIAVGIAAARQTTADQLSDSGQPSDSLLHDRLDNIYEAEVMTIVRSRLNDLSGNGTSGDAQRSGIDAACKMFGR